VKAIGTDDWLIVGSLFFAIAYNVASIVSIHFGNGYPITSLTPYQLEGFLKSLYALIINYYAVLGLFKISILVQYVRLFKRSLQRVCYVMMVIVGAHSIASMFVQAFFCSPVQYFWDRTIPGGTCLDGTAVWLAIGLIHIVTDVIIYILPLRVLWQLQLPRRQKMALSGIFAVGLFVVLVSILRLPDLYEYSTSLDPVYDAPSVGMWTIIEGNSAVCVACLPALKPLIAKTFPRIFGSTASRSGSSTNAFVVAQRVGKSYDSEKAGKDGSALDVSLDGRNIHVSTTFEHRVL
jgi:hypothetical protein